MNAARRIACTAALLAAGCVVNPVVTVLEPTSARPQPVAVPSPAAQNGAIFSATTHRPLFEDRRARLVGDTLVVRIDERTSAQQRSSTSVQRSGSVEAAVPTVRRLPGNSFQDLALEANSEIRHSGKGETAASNLFTGTIAVTVVEVLPNGNLVVSGEKQLGTNRETERMRFSGVVNPASILAGNVVSSTQVADARLEYRGRGQADSAQMMGWLARFFLSVLPF